MEEGEDLCRLGCVEPTRDPEPKRECMVDPVLRGIFFFLAINWFATREAIGSMVFFCRNVDKLEIEEKNHGNPSVAGSIRLYCRVTQHTPDELRIHLYD